MKWAARVLWWCGEAAVTFGVVVLLLVVHQLWWTNVQAQGSDRRAVAALERQWNAAPAGSAVSAASSAAPASSPSATRAAGTGNRQTSDVSSNSFVVNASWGMAYAIIRIPAIGVTAPIAEGTSKAAVLNFGYVGHYPQTAEPGQPGNFALAGHRNTHGEPFRYINRLRPGDEVVIETAHAVFTYVLDRMVPQTSPSDGTVIDPVPYSGVHPEDRLSGPGYYITLTTCTPEFTSEFRLVWWGYLRSADVRG
ncbi:class E sortase [Streptomyces sp. RB6PN25]|uniref:Class E sortase n=1 Tax=Streptomyces humicola TaxID=2953240 RepID=A0ABT1Q1J6_9ACTN|nr:class E sortase [Streptomyces humicola]MCQ4083807.1 class E sortase [Streptomyces humicola]